MGYFLHKELIFSLDGQKLLLLLLLLLFTSMGSHHWRIRYRRIGKTDMYDSVQAFSYNLGL